MTYEYDNNNFATTTGAYEVETSVNDKVSISGSVTAVTDKGAEKAAKKAEREAKKVLADAAKADDKAAKALARAEAKAATEAKKVAEKAAKATARQAAKDKKAADEAAAVAKATAIAAAVNSVLRKGDAIAEKYEASETSKVDFKNSSRQVTYDLLVEVMAYVEELNKRNDVSDVLDTMRWELRKKWKIKTQDNTSDLGVIVKYITRTKRKNAHMYARVLEEAFKHKANSGNLLIYIEQRGGINKIVAGSKAIGIKNKNRVVNGYKRYAQGTLVQQLNTAPLGKIKLTKEQETFYHDVRGKTRFAYTFCKIVNGELVVIDFVPEVTDTQEDQLLQSKTLSEIGQLSLSVGMGAAKQKVHGDMALLFEKYNAGRIKRGLKTYDDFGEVVGDRQTTDFTAISWNEFEAE